MLSLSVCLSSPDAYPFLSRRGTIISKPKVSWLLQEKTAKNTGGVDLLVFLHTCVLLNRLGGDGCGRLRGVVLLNVSCGSGDGSPSLATTDANSKCAKDQRKDEKSFHCCFKFKLV